MPPLPCDTHIYEQTTGSVTGEIEKIWGKNYGLRPKPSLGLIDVIAMGNPLMDVMKAEGVL